jgi:branched-chain amino acid transport system substrate-binding protein
VGGTGEVIKLGMFAPLTGPLAATGVPARDGLQTWVDEVNASGGINGHQLELIAYDDQNNPQQAVSAARRLIEQDKVFAIMCGSNSGSTLAALPVITQAKVPFVTCISAHRDLFKPFSPYVYRMYANEVAQANADADYVAGNLKAKRPAIIYNSNDFGVGGFDAMTARFKDQWNLDFVAAEKYNVGDQDFTSQLLKIKSANPDALIVHAFAADAGIIVRQAKQLGLNVPLIGGGGTPTPLFPKAAGDAGDGFVAVWVFPVLPDASFPPVKDYIGKLQQYVYPSGLPTGRPSLYDMTGYCAGTIIGEAMQKAGADLTQTTVLQQLDSLKDFTPGNGMCYPVTFTPDNHEGTDQTTLVKVNANQQFELFQP